MWFGKKTVEKAIFGIGSFIDEQQFTPQEQLTAKLELFQELKGFKVVQRIIVTWVMYVWASYALVGLASLLLGYFLYVWGETDKEAAFSLSHMILEYAKVPFIWTPCLGVFGLYLSGGLSFLKGGKK